MAENLRLSGAAPAVAELELRVAQARLAFLIQQGRTSWPRASTPTARHLTEPLVIRARELWQADRPMEALALLEEAEALDPEDPHLPFQRAEMLNEMGRTVDAIAAYRRNVVLDPTHALVFYRLGLAYKASGDRVHAVYYLDQASRRSAEGGSLQRRADWEILKLTVPVILTSGLADGSTRRGADTVAGFSREAFSSSDPRIAWWGSMAPRWVPRREELFVRWIDPSGQVVQELPAEARRKPRVAAVLELTPELAQRHGVWRVQVLFEGDVVDEQTFALRP
jgi:tetratricopeptide (TPR) repeat protein